MLLTYCDAYPSMSILILTPLYLPCSPLFRQQSRCLESCPQQMTVSQPPPDVSSFPFSYFPIFSACNMAACALVSAGATVAGQLMVWGGKAAWPHLRRVLHHALAPGDQPPPVPPREIRRDPESSSGSNDSIQPAGRTRRISRSKPVLKTVNWDPEAGGRSMQGRVLPATPGLHLKDPVPDTTMASPATSTPIVRSHSSPPSSRPTIRSTASVAVQATVENDGTGAAGVQAQTAVSGATPRARGRVTPRSFRLDMSQPPRAAWFPDSLYTTALSPVTMANQDRSHQPPSESERFKDADAPKEEPEDKP